MDKKKVKILKCGFKIKKGLKEISITICIIVKYTTKTITMESYYDYKSCCDFYVNMGVRHMEEIENLDKLHSLGIYTKTEIRAMKKIIIKRQKEEDARFSDILIGFTVDNIMNIIEKNKSIEQRLNNSF